jgi:hypothetical protein
MIVLIFWYIYDFDHVFQRNEIAHVLSQWCIPAQHSHSSISYVTRKQKECTVKWKRKKEEWMMMALSSIIKPTSSNKMKPARVCSAHIRRPYPARSLSLSFSVQSYMGNAVQALKHTERYAQETRIED